MGFDRDATLFFYIHRVHDLRAHLTVANSAALLNETVSKRAFAVVDVSDDAKISNVFHEIPS